MQVVVDRRPGPATVRSGGRNTAGGPAVAVIEKTIEIAAPPERVYDLITGVEDYPGHTGLIETVTRTGPDTWHWRARIAGIPLEWESAFTRRERPLVVAWRSVSGLENRGEYHLEPCPAGTRLRFRMEYRPPPRLAWRVLRPVVAGMLEETFEEILQNIKKRLEERQDDGDPDQTER